MKSSDLSKKNSKKTKLKGFADFFLHASEKEKHDVLKRAAQRANQDQRELVASSRLRAKTS